VYRGRKLKIFSGTANLGLSEEIVEHVGVPLGITEVKRFSDGEIAIYIGESVRGRMCLLSSLSAALPTRT
jgi:ribose-phosphate pyrophosphokinase